MNFIERESRYWVVSQAGEKNEGMFKEGTKAAWNWAKTATDIRWFTDGERRYGKELWQLASQYLSKQERAQNCPFSKVWREGLEVAMKIKGSQGRPRVEWVKQEHPWTAISRKAEVHANHNEAQNASLRRRCSAFRRGQNLYAKTQDGLQRVLDVQRIIHNWVRPHWGLGKKTTPAMKMGYSSRPVTMGELLNSRGFDSLLL